MSWSSHAGDAGPAFEVAMDHQSSARHDLDDGRFHGTLEELNHRSGDFYLYIRICNIYIYTHTCRIYTYKSTVSTSVRGRVGDGISQCHDGGNLHIFISLHQIRG